MTERHDYLRDGAAIYGAPSPSSAPRPISSRFSAGRSRRRRAHDPCLRQRRSWRAQVVFGARPRRGGARGACAPARRSSAMPRWWRTASRARGCRPTTRWSARCAIRACRRSRKKLGTTRSAAALDLWGDRLAGAVVAIGNAPTALFHLLEMLDAGAPKPAAILGMPVGFVGAAESKDALAADPPACRSSSCAAASAAAP